jgi:SMODS-associated and fused to various effectors sensor domain
MRRAEDLRTWRRLLRRTFDKIKAVCGRNAEIHVFPALPVSAAIEAGRVWMPEADLPLVIYDEATAASCERSTSLLQCRWPPERSAQPSSVSSHSCPRQRLILRGI